MINPERVKQFAAMIEAAPVYVRKSGTEKPRNNAIVLNDDMPDTLAEAFRKNSDVRYHWNSIDLWSIYSKGHYQQIEDETNIEGYIRRFIQVVKMKKKIKKGSEFVMITVLPTAKMKTDTFIKHVMKWLRDDPAVYLRPSQKSPCSLTGKLDPRFIIPMENGLLDWSEYPYVLHDPTPDFYSLQRLPFKWNKDKQESDMWTDYMVDATGGDEEHHTLLQQWAGYCFMKGNQDAQKFIILYGEAGTGKNVYSEVLSAGLGLENVSVVPLVNFNEPHLVTQTYGKMLNITDESETYLEQGIESALKHYTGGGQYQFKRMYGKPFSAYPTAKIMILTNHLPAFTDTSNGIWRRLLVAPFDYVVPDDKKIEGFANQIIKTEMSGVLAWALAGARSLMKYGFIIPEKCKQVAAIHRLESVPEIQFMQENIEACDPDEIWGRISCSQFREAYVKFCKEQGVLPKGVRNLSKTIRKLFPLSERKRGRADGDLGYFYYGLKVQDGSIYK